MGQKTEETAQAKAAREFIEENLKELRSREKTARMLNATVKKNFFVRILRALFYYCIYIPVFTIFDPIALRLKIKNKKNLKAVKKSGGILISNHVHKLDNTFAALAVYPRKVYFTGRIQNFHLKGAGGFLKALGVIPTPSDVIETKVFFYALSEMLRRKKVVHFYPEGEQLYEYDTRLWPFKKGAFHLAVTANKPIVPTRVIYRARKNPNKKPYITLAVGEPLYPDLTPGFYPAVDDLKARAEDAMQKLGENHAVQEVKDV